MRFLVKVAIPTASGNALIRDPKFGQRLSGILGEIKPEATYFTVEDGQRTIYLVVDIAESSRIPAITEPLWLALEARVDVIPAMNEQEFAQAGPSIEQAARKY